MDTFAEHLKEKSGEKALLTGDGATAHSCQDWKRWEGVDWVRQPTACPELNPVERFFGELRRHTSNRTFANVQQVEELIERLVEGYMSEPEKVTKLTSFPYIKSSACN